jgi:diaminopimelate epimerase
LGVTKSLRAGVTATGEAWTEMPGSLDFSKIEQESEKTFVVHLDGITHIVTFDETIFAGQAPDALKDIAMRMIRERALDARPATGVMFVRQSEELLSLEPVVYVSAIDTLFYESACGSGTAAIGMALAMRSGTSEQNIVLQPSGMPIEVRTEVKDDAFTSVRIQGPIHILPQ